MTGTIVLKLFIDNAAWDSLYKYLFIQLMKSSIERLHHVFFIITWKVEWGTVTECRYGIFECRMERFKSF